MPVVGSVGQSALNLTAGARTRWASVFSGLWLLVIIVALGGVVGRVPVATLAGLLVIAGLQAVRTREISAVLSVRRSSAIAMVVTFVATLLLPVAQAVGVGVLVSILLQLNQDALDLRVVELRTGVEGHTEEHPAPERLRPREVVVLDVYGSLYYAGAQTLQRRLPDPTGVDAPVVVLRLRGRGFPPATFFFVIREYAQQLDEAGGRLYLSGVDPAVRARYGDLGGALTGPFNVVEATTVLGESTAEARAMGEDWLRRHNGGSERETD
jgi:SulP family sulfate permease